MAALTSGYTIRASNPQAFRIAVTLGKYPLQSELILITPPGPQIPNSSASKP